MQQNDNAGKWVTIRGNHVFIADAPRGTVDLSNPSGTGPTPQDSEYLQHKNGDNGSDPLPEISTPEQDLEWETRNPVSAKAMRRLIESRAESRGYIVKGFHATHSPDPILEFDRLRGYRNPNGTNVEALGAWFTDSPENARTLYGPNVDSYFLKTSLAGSSSLKRYSGVGAWKKLHADVVALGGVEEYRKINRVFNGVALEGDYVDGELQTVHVMFEPNYIKSARTITRDGGKLVLPSQRFNYKSPDTRY